MIMGIFRDHFLNIRYIQKLGYNSYWRTIKKQGVAPEGVSRIGKSTYHVGELELDIDPMKHPYLLTSLNMLLELKRSCHAKFSYLDGKFIIEIAEVKYPAVTMEEIATVWEIYYERAYDLSGIQNALVLDIGMNVGFSSLYFASKGHSVVGYEPMAPTYARAMENFVLNPQISSSILSHNYGLGQEGREIMVPYSFDQKGSVGIQGTSGDLKRFDSMEKMRIIPVEDALKELFSKKDKELIIKCDCEGAEYEIIESLIKNDLISKVSVILMEWHLFDGHEKFERMMAQLEKSGFVIHTSPNGRNRRVGMLYGCNHNVCKEHSSS